MLASAEMAEKAKAVLVYIAEAHAQDEWPIRSGRFNGERGPVLVNQPKTILERCKLARQFQHDFKVDMPVLIDDPLDEAFEKAYAPWPMRIFLVKEGRLLWISSPNGCGFESIFEDLRQCLLSEDSKEKAA